MIDVWTMDVEEECVRAEPSEWRIVLELHDLRVKRWIQLVEKDWCELRRCYVIHPLPNGGHLIVTAGEGNTVQRHASDHCSEWVSFLRRETGWQGQVYNAQSLLYLAPQCDVSLDCAYRAQAFAINLCHPHWSHDQEEDGMSSSA